MKSSEWQDIILLYYIKVKRNGLLTVELWRLGPTTPAHVLHMTCHTFSTNFPTNEQVMAFSPFNDSMTVLMLNIWNVDITYTGIPFYLLLLFSC